MSDQIQKEIDAIDATDTIPKNQMLQILKVLNERRRQDAKWGEQNHNDYYWLGILAEEFGEAAKALIESATRAHPPIPIKPPENDVLWFERCQVDQYQKIPLLEKELTHVAAVAIAWLEAIQRRRA